MEKFTEMLNKYGWDGRIIPISRLADLKKVFTYYYENGLIDQTLYREQLDFLSFDPPADLPGARSIIIIAVPTPQMRLFFHRHGERAAVIIPPTYVSYTPRIERVQQVLADWLSAAGYGLAKPQLPLKTLAVRSGLARYGRNNICYVNSKGSFIQFAGAFSDLSCSSDPWQEPRALDRCASCTACMKHCPTAAIKADRFLLHAELCLTYHNESANDFPSWINPDWHHCLLGCMHCQSLCPENKSVLNWFEDRAEFSEQETDFLIGQVPLQKLPAATQTKIRDLEINEDYYILCRNLSLIIEQNDNRIVNKYSNGKTH